VTKLNKKPKLTRADKERAKLAALLGIDAPAPVNTQEQETVSREAEATLAYMEDPKHFIRKTCKMCNRTFAHTRGAVAFCSDTCRAEGLALIGIQWNWLRPPDQRWRHMPEPLVVPPEAITVIDQLDAESNEESDAKMAAALAIAEELGLE